MTDNCESSVVFNLAELMQLEHERVLAEQHAVLAAERQVVEARRERERQQHAEQERARVETEQLARVASESAHRIEIEREAMLLRVRLEAEAAERLELARVAAAQESARLRTHADAKQRTTTRTLAAALAVAVTGFGAAYAQVIVPAMHAAQLREADARALATSVTRELERARAMHSVVSAPVHTQPAFVAEPLPDSIPVVARVEPTSAPKPTRSTVRDATRAHAVDPRRAPSHAPTDHDNVLIDIDSNDPDPLRGMFDSAPAREHHTKTPH